MTKAKQRRNVHYHQGYADGYKGRPVMYVNPPKRFSYRYRYGRGANKPLRGFRRRVWVYRAYMVGRRRGRHDYWRDQRRQRWSHRITMALVGFVSLLLTSLTLLSISQ